MNFSLSLCINRSGGGKPAKRLSKYSIIVNGTLWQRSPRREIEDVDFENILTKTYHALPWQTISNQSKLDDPALSNIYQIFGINPEMHLIVAAYNKKDLRKYHSHVRGGLLSFCRRKTGPFTWQVTNTVLLQILVYVCNLFRIRNKLEKHF